MIFTGGHRSRTAAANLRPSVPPGWSTSVNRNSISGVHLQQADGPIGIACLEHSKTAVGQLFGYVHQNRGLVFDDEHGEGQS